MPLISWFINFIISAVNLYIMSWLLSIIGITITLFLSAFAFIPERHIAYLNYVARHKAFVFRAGLKTGAPLWRLLIHDWSKFTPAEWFPYTEYFYGGHAKQSFRYLVCKTKFNRAWLHHLHSNAHHWQYWVLRNDDGTTKALPMPEHYVREMVADWFGAGRAITGKWEAGKWYSQNAHKMVLHQRTRAEVEALIARTHLGPVN